VIIGGKFIDDPNFKGRYLDLIKLLSEKVRKVLGFEPVVFEPKGKDEKKGKSGADNVYYDTENRRAFLLRSKMNSNTKIFTQSNIEEVKGDLGK
jgi:hypothetical protein